MYQSVGKRLLDLIISGSALVVLSPILLVVWLLLAITNKGEVFFLQERPGLDGVPFTILKFKTMTDDVDRFGELLPDEKRVTRVGHLVRKFSLDEILQFINVLKGDMSVIGPRPLLMQYMEHYSPTQRRRHEIRPGITGLAQVKGRNSLSWERRFRYDIFYVDHVSFAFDLLILLWTIKSVCTSRGVDVPEEYFTGSKVYGNA